MTRPIRSLRSVEVSVVSAKVSRGGPSIKPTRMRDDVLVYSTPPLKEKIEVTGSVLVSLYLSSDAKDTDLTIKLLDVRSGRQGI